jgi:uncharacterized membrane protein YfcA
MDEIGVRHLTSFTLFYGCDSKPIGVSIAPASRDPATKESTLTDFLPALNGQTLAIAAMALIAGAVRGFAGFGGGMILIPFVSAFFGPQIGASAILVADGILTVPYLIRSIRRYEPKTVLPVALGAILAIPIGTYLLSTVDPTPIRWAIAPLIGALVALLLSGWRYKDTPPIATSVSVGAAAGFLSGLIQISGPPVVALWISGPAAPQTIRANIYVFFGVTTVIAMISYAVGGIFHGNLVPVLVAIVPGYSIGLIAGSRFFGRADPAIFRRIAIGLIAVSVIVSLPILDPYIR